MVANVERVNRYVASTPVINCNVDTARYFGQIKQGLKSKGRPIPENAIWIAAVILQHGLTLVTRNHHFNEVDGLNVEAW